MQPGIGANTEYFAFAHHCRSETVDAIHILCAVIMCRTCAVWSVYKMLVFVFVHTHYVPTILYGPAIDLDLFLSKDNM